MSESIQSQSISDLTSQSGNSRNQSYFSFGKSNAQPKAAVASQEDSEEEYYIPRPVAARRPLAKSTTSKSEASDDTVDTTRVPVFQVRDPISSPQGTSTTLPPSRQTYQADYGVTSASSQQTPQPSYGFSSTTAPKPFQPAKAVTTSTTTQSFHDLGEDDYDVADWD
jgi:hypothetical protein